jgi:polyisoprenoid-binding protein YceI
LTFAIVSEESEARYRIREQLAGRDLPNDAIGATRAVSGQLAVDASGKLLPEQSRFEVAVIDLKSDSSRRDGYVARNTLQADTYPLVTFLPTEVRGLPSPVPDSGEGSFELVGDLTIRNATRPAVWAVTLRRSGQMLTGQARTTFDFADFGIPQPRVPVVLSVADDINLELDLTMRQQ